MSADDIRPTLKVMEHARYSDEAWLWKDDFRHLFSHFT